MELPAGNEWTHIPHEIRSRRKIIDSNVFLGRDKVFPTFDMRFFLQSLQILGESAPSMAALSACGTTMGMDIYIMHVVLFYLNDYSLHVEHNDVVFDCFFLKSSFLKTHLCGTFKQDDGR